MLLNPYRFSNVGVAFNPLDKGSGITISNSDRTLSSGATGWQSTRSKRSKAAGKLYFEWVADGNNNGGMLGIATAALTVGSQYPGQTAASWGYYYNSAGGEVYNNGSASLSGSGVVTVGSYGRVAIDIDAGKLWFGNAASWKSSGDPAAGTNPTFTFTPNQTLFMTVGLNTSGNSGTLRSTTAQVVGSVPSGFTPWDN